MLNRLSELIEDDEHTEEDSLLVAPVVCSSPCGSVALAAKKIGITCQGIFTRAYTEAGYTDQYARAVFVEYLAANRSILPPIVYGYCVDIARHKAATRHAQEGTCFACRLDPNTFPGLVLSYRLIEPNVTRETLVGKTKRVRAGAKTELDKKVFEERFLKFLEERDVLEETEEDWRSMMND